MTKLKLPADHLVDSTDTNEYAEGLRDEDLAESYLYDTDVAVDDYIPDGVNENEDGDRPLYDEQGYVKMHMPKI